MLALSKMIMKKKTNRQKGQKKNQVFQIMKEIVKFRKSKIIICCKINKK
jgi:hypothetical protein